MRSCLFNHKIIFYSAYAEEDWGPCEESDRKFKEMCVLWNAKIYFCEAQTIILTSSDVHLRPDCNTLWSRGNEILDLWFIQQTDFNLEVPKS